MPVSPPSPLRVRKALFKHVRRPSSRVAASSDPSLSTQYILATGPPIAPPGPGAAPANLPPTSAPPLLMGAMGWTPASGPIPRAPMPAPRLGAAGAPPATGASNGRPPIVGSGTPPTAFLLDACTIGGTAPPALATPSSAAASEAMADDLLLPPMPNHCAPGVPVAYPSLVLVPAASPAAVPAPPPGGAKAPHERTLNMPNKSCV
ncbi:hypothetical protein C8Q79DRAFT_927714 [Trametes meyenii]|nr:hypothetical protein C8Q79DRAFT_927714 [Trametes meyenii]